MKKVLLIAAVVAMICSCCGNGQKKTAGQNDQNIESINDGHNAQNSLDYQGVYTGTLPTASGEGMIVTLTLGDSTYVRNTEYKKGVFEDKGAYKWKEDGSTIVLEGITGAPDSYFVSENYIVQLDMEGNRVEGDLADLYILKKVIEE
ncbi:lipoprotein [Bacteroidia bacterium]|nr:lipoprotein [Bacteroidia bacterium]